MDFQSVFRVAASTAVVALAGFSLALFVVRRSAPLRRLSWGITIAAFATVPVVIIGVCSIRSEARTAPQRPVTEAVPQATVVAEPAPVAPTTQTPEVISSPAAAPPSETAPAGGVPSPSPTPVPVVTPAVPPPQQATAPAPQVVVLQDFETPPVHKCPG